jgi:hypothetical protein
MKNADYLDISTQEREFFFFFMFNSFLCARIDTENETEDDEDVNMYMAHLLQSAVDGRFYVDHAGVLATSPVDVYEKGEEQGDNRHKLEVYRSNADHRLISYGVFSSFGQRQSLYRQNSTPPEAHLEYAQEYYSWAAAFSARLPDRYKGLTEVLEKIAARFDTYQAVLAHMRARYFNFLPRLTPGQLFHLEREIHDRALPQIKESVLDQLLEAYNQWRIDPGEETRRKFEEASERYHQLVPDFDPQELN